MSRNQEKLLEQIFQLKFTAKTLVRQSKKCEKEEKEEKLKVKRAIEKGNVDGARVYAQNAIRKRTEQLSYLRLSSRLDAVVSRLETQAKMNVVTTAMGNIVRALDSALASNNLQKISETMDTFEKQFVNMEVQAQFVEGAMSGSTALSTPEDSVNQLIQEVADEHRLELNMGLPDTSRMAAPVGKETVTAPAVNQEDDLSRRLAELKSRN